MGAAGSAVLSPVIERPTAGPGSAHRAAGFTPSSPHWAPAAPRRAMGMSIGSSAAPGQELI